MPQGRFVPEPWPVVPPLEEEVPVPVRAMPRRQEGLGEAQLRRENKRHILSMAYKKPPP